MRWGGRCGSWRVGCGGLQPRAARGVTCGHPLMCGAGGGDASKIPSECSSGLVGDRYSTGASMLSARWLSPQSASTSLRQSSPDAPRRRSPSGARSGAARACQRSWSCMERAECDIASLVSHECDAYAPACPANPSAAPLALGGGDARVLHCRASASSRRPP